MNTIEAICSRKSIRSYTGEQITEDELNTILKAANASPVGMGQYDSIHLTVITNTNLLSMIDIAGAKMLGKPDSHALYGAPMLILISTRKPPMPILENTVHSNAAIIAHNIALAATDLGVGACYIWGAVAAVNNNQSILNELQLPENFIPSCAVALGKTEQLYEKREIPMDRIKCKTID